MWLDFAYCIRVHAMYEHVQDLNPQISLEMLKFINLKIRHFEKNVYNFALFRPQIWPTILFWGRFFEEKNILLSFKIIRSYVLGRKGRG